MAGIPTVVVTRSGFEGIVNNAFAGFGFNAEASKGYVFPTEMFLQGSDLSPIEEHFTEFIENGLIKKPFDGLKVLGDGEITKKLTVKAAKFTNSAKEKIEAAGGKAEVI